MPMNVTSRAQVPATPAPPGTPHAPPPATSRCDMTGTTPASSPSRRSPVRRSGEAVQHGRTPTGQHAHNPATITITLEDPLAHTPPTSVSILSGHRRQLMPNPVPPPPRRVRTTPRRQPDGQHGSGRRIIPRPLLLLRQLLISGRVGDSSGGGHARGQEHDGTGVTFNSAKARRNRRTSSAPSLNPIPRHSTSQRTPPRSTRPSVRRHATGHTLSRPVARTGPAPRAPAPPRGRRARPSRGVRPACAPPRTVGRPHRGGRAASNQEAGKHATASSLRSPASTRRSPKTRPCRQVDPQ